jgi:2-polyprenyl-3-methyl-5-hydroxy-6-metoxy-1,4-benzoquinol methylase
MPVTSASPLPVNQPDERRFGFGRNWKAFGRHIDERRIDDARQSLTRLTGLDDFTGLRLVDVGCGSGLFSLAAARLGARVHSFDYDTESVATTREVKTRFAPDHPAWTIEQGSILDEAYVRRLGTFDIVYSWGVLHHTGQMYEAFERAADLVAPGGRLAIAIYNDQGWISRYWLAVKRAYNANAASRRLVVAAHLPYLAARWTARTLKQRRPERGMRLWTDLLDWLGGYPFEVATPDAVTAFFQQRGFTSQGLWTCGRRHGCNEFLFQRLR